MTQNPKKNPDADRGVTPDTVPNLDHQPAEHSRASPGVIEQRSTLADVGEASEQGEPNQPGAGETKEGMANQASTPPTQGPPNKPGRRTQN
jgi:hypothetical protein